VRAYSLLKSWGRDIPKLFARISSVRNPASFFPVSRFDKCGLPIPVCAAKSYWFQPLLFLSRCNFLPKRIQISSLAIPQECLYPLGYVVAYRIQAMETDNTELEQVKADVYETWAAINRAFEQIITALDKLEKRGVLKDDYVQDQSIITNDL
jgi:hypothetical protein